MADLLSVYNAPDVKEFQRDFVQMVKVGAEINRHYGEARASLDTLIPKYLRLVGQFNIKYKGMEFKARQGIEEFRLRIFIKSNDIKGFFAESASKIPGLKSVGRQTPEQVQVSDAEKFSSFLDSILDKIFLSYIDQDSGVSSLGAVFDRNERMIEIIYTPAEAMNENSAVFRICAFYALKEGIDKGINVYSEANTFGFQNVLNEADKREWYDKFNPAFLG